MKKLLIIILLTNYIFCLKVLQHNCIHNKINQIYKYEALAPLEPVDIRNLGGIQPRNMLISFDMNFFQKLAATNQAQVLVNACSKAMLLARQYFNNLIKIIPKSEQNMRYRQYNPKCGEYPIPKKDRDQGINSDLHIYTQYKIEPAETYLAYASWCQFLDGIGPTHGQVNFNLGILGTKNMQDPVEFEDLMEIVIHEMTHILGFSDSDIPRWVDLQGRPHNNPLIKLNVRGTPTLLVRTPHVLNYARKYFNCPNLAGMPLENNGGEGSAGSHWETTVIQNEYMNAAQSPTQAYFSAFTTNLLRDTGFFYEVDSSMEEQTFYGLGEGCNHVFGTCDPSRKEYCRPRIDDGQCDYYNHGSSSCEAGKYLDRGCNTLSTYSNSKCWDIKSNLNTQNNALLLGTKFGISSRCFPSTILKLGYQPETIPKGYCYQFQCTPNGQQVVVLVGGQKVLCQKNLQQLSVKGYSGYIVCPDNIIKFCGYKRFCPNFCSANGVCINNKCICIKGFYGPDCYSNKPV